MVVWKNYAIFLLQLTLHPPTMGAFPNCTGLSMRINRSQPAEHSPPENALFRSFSPLLLALLRQREEVDLDTYVEMPGPEAALTAFLESQSNDICLVVGDKGIGKSSLLRYAALELWPPKKCFVIFKDCTSQSLFSNLGGPTFYSLAEDKQQAIATEVAKSYIATVIKEYVLPHYQQDESPKKFASLIRSLFPGYLPNSFLQGQFIPTDVLSHVETHWPDAYMFMLLYFHIVQCGYTHVKLVLDNLDDKDVHVLIAFKEQLAHLESFVRTASAAERRLDAGQPVRRANGIISCRRITLSRCLAKLGTDILRSGAGWYGTHPIRITDCCDLAQALVKRYDKLIRRDEFKDKKAIVEIAGKRWEIDDKDSFFRRIIQAFRRAGQAGDVIRLCNNDVADAMTAVFDVVRNVHFIKAERLLADLVNSASKDMLEDDFGITPLSASDVFTNTIVIRCLAYGNQGENRPKPLSPRYPIARTQVGNVLTDHELRFGQTMFRPRVIQLLLRMHDDAAPVTLDLLCNLGSRWFGLTSDRTIAAVDDMFQERLIENLRVGGLPSHVGGQCDLAATPRAAVLFSHLESDCVLLECYRDIFHLDEMLVYLDRAVRWEQGRWSDLPYRDREEQLCWLLTQSWMGEKAELERQVGNKRGAFRRFCDDFDDPFITEVLKAGVMQSWYRFYSRSDYPDMHYADFERHLMALQEDMDESRRRWLQL